ncbi:MAG: hypothetical protein MZU95_11045 [Desulfomicrobium escambiense]|nr:hypothetical protein [Desulfomicrobium escambiense]
MIVRDEAAADIPAIFEITELAFRDHPHSIHNEQFIVNVLRAAGALAVSPAETAGKVVGHIAFSAVAVSDGSGGLVRPRPGIGAARAPEAGGGQRARPAGARAAGRAVGRRGLRPRGRSRLLRTLRIQGRAGAGL